MPDYKLRINNLRSALKYVTDENKRSQMLDDIDHLTDLNDAQQEKKDRDAYNKKEDKKEAERYEEIEGKVKKVGDTIGSGISSSMKTIGRTSGTLFEKMAIQKKPQQLANKMMFGMPPGFEKTYGERETYNSKGGIGPQDLVYTFGERRQSNANESIINPSTSFVFPSKMPTGVVEEEEIEPIPFYDEKTEVAIINKVPKRINPLRAEREVFSKDPIQEIFGMKVIR